jgi:hypothetical protein
MLVAPKLANFTLHMLSGIIPVIAVYEACLSGYV